MNGGVGYGRPGILLRTAIVVGHQPGHRGLPFTVASSDVDVAKSELGPGSWQPQVQVAVDEMLAQLAGKPVEGLRVMYPVLS